MAGYPFRKDVLALIVEYVGASPDEAHYFVDCGTVCAERMRKKWDKIIPAHDWDYY